MHYLTVPGYTGSGPDHWQTHLENTYEGFSRVVQDDWARVERDRWVATLDEAVRAVDDEVLLIGHSCGAVTVAQWAATRWDSRVTGALLVAPADVEAADALPAIAPQAPLPKAPLPMRTQLVVSDNDPFLSLARALHLADVWDSAVEIVPGGGHLATRDGYGPWDHVARLIEQFCGTALETTEGRVPDAR
ncbi:MULTISPECIES: alpha/beta hydrolase [unclassified Streptomyces]|uniref:RBBP9/YdeN family alpha/beta hydrolase n=1 Tax=Streptomyces TaxID=1883 RepID=UPI000DC775C1|nr:MULTISPECIES: alpha/beta hydrolase [unclassified Streptomyces]AWZ06334.1 alpha/beta hydrolase [Streptomyces sp. ICC4]AWZ15248.1 alpha/beta hydrolase [Streptomyces sp. ICC1]